MLGARVCVWQTVVCAFLLLCCILFSIVLLQIVTLSTITTSTFQLMPFWTARNAGPGWMRALSPASGSPILLIPQQLSTRDSDLRPNKGKPQNRIIWLRELKLTTALADIKLQSCRIETRQIARFTQGLQQLSSVHWFLWESFQRTKTEKNAVQMCGHFEGDSPPAISYYIESEWYPSSQIANNCNITSKFTASGNFVDHCEIRISEKWVCLPFLSQSFSILT